MLLTSSPACLDTTNRGLSRRTYNFVLLYGYMKKSYRGQKDFACPNDIELDTVSMSAWVVGPSPSKPEFLWLSHISVILLDCPNRNPEWWRQHTSGDPELRLHPPPLSPLFSVSYEELRPNGVTGNSFQRVFIRCHGNENCNPAQLLEI